MLYWKEECGVPEPRDPGLHPGLNETAQAEIRGDDMDRCRWWKRVLIAGLILGMGCTGRAQASSTVDLDKINAEAQIADTSVLVDTDMTNQEIIDATDLDKDAIAKYRKLWESDPARVQYYIVDMDQNDDNIMISTALSGELGLNDANDIKSSQEDQVLRNMKKKLRKSEGKISDFEKIYVGGRLSWRYFMDIKNRHTYEYQTIYNGTVMTFSIAQKNTFEGEEEVLDEFMDTVRFEDSGSTGLASSRPLDARTRLLIGAGVGVVAVLLLLVGVLSLIRRKPDRG